MTDYTVLGANYCPDCGSEVDHAEKVAAPEELTTQGTFEKTGAHVIIEGNEVRIYRHAESGDD